MTGGPQERLSFGRPEGSGGTAESGPVVLTVEELNRRVRDLLTEHFGTVWVEGELSGIKYYRSGGRTRIYGTIKDANAEARLVLWEESVSALRFELEDGMKVLALADVSLYPQRGQFQLVVREVRPAGVGELELAFQQLKDKLAGEGLFDEERKRPVPLFPFRVGVVTSRQAAALRDFMIISRHRNPAVRILVAPARVQGEGAAEEIARGIARLNTIDGLDCIVITRGGGSLEDLWPFNEEVVARAVAASTLPVISAVGHETDWTISDMVADLRMPTPSAAAERVAWPREEWAARIIEQRDRMGRVIRTRVQGLMQRVGWFTRAHGFQTLGIRLREATQQLDEALRRLPVGFRHRLEVAGRDLLSAGERMRSASVSALERRERQLTQLLRTVNALSPIQVLERGYAIARRPEGGPVVRSATELEPGVPLEVYLREGMAEVRVEDTGPGLESLVESTGDPASEEG